MRPSGDQRGDDGHAEHDAHEARPALFRDERSLVLAAETGVTGRIPDGISVAGFAAGMQQASGRGIGLSARAGAEWEIIPGWLRLRAGSYWEPARIVDRHGRLHVTGGVEVRLVQFKFWDKERRLRIAIAADGAREYQNFGLSIGFWH